MDNILTSYLYLGILYIYQMIQWYWWCALPNCEQIFMWIFSISMNAKFFGLYSTKFSTNIGLIIKFCLCEDNIDCRNCVDSHVHTRTRTYAYASMWKRVLVRMYAASVSWISWAIERIGDKYLHSDQQQIESYAATSQFTQQQIYEQTGSRHIRLMCIQTNSFSDCIQRRGRGLQVKIDFKNYIACQTAAAN